MLRNERGEGEIVVIGFVGFVLLVLIGLGMWLLPLYAVYHQNMMGQAKLAEAQSSRQVAVAEARAKDEAATFLAQAEVRRAEGVAKANAIIGESLKGNDAYLRYLWIDKLGDNDHSIIYIPTEAGLPLTEAGRKP